jgi:hypothetical protein
MERWIMLNNWNRGTMEYWKNGLERKRQKTGGKHCKVENAK